MLPLLYWNPPITDLVPDLLVEWAPSKKATEEVLEEDWVIFSESENETAGHAQSCEIKRGQKKGRGQVSTGTAILECTNITRALDPFDPISNPTSDLKEGKQFRISILFNGQKFQRFQGFLVRPDPRTPSMGYNSTVTLQLADAFAVVARNAVDEADFPEQDAGTRMEAVLDASDVLPFRRQIDPGISTLTNVELRSKPVLDELRQIAKDTAGRVFASPAGKIVFLNRHRQIHPDRDYFDIKATFGNDPGGLSKPVFTGIGTDGLVATGPYTGQPSTEFLVQVDGPNTFRWSINGGVTFEETAVPMVPATPHLLVAGVSVEFTFPALYIEGDFWEFSAGQIPFFDVEGTFSPVRNKVQVRGASGNLQVAEDAASQEEYTTKTDPIRASQLADDNEAFDYATFKLNESKQPRRRYNRVGIRPSCDVLLSAAMWDKVFRLRIGDKVRVVEVPKQPGGVVVEAVCIIEGIQDSWAVRTWKKTEFFLSPALTNTYWILQDPVYGRLNSTTRPAF